MNCGVFKEAWQKLKGMKRHFWTSAILFVLITLGGFSVLGSLLFLGQLLFFPSLFAVINANALFFLDPAVALPMGIVVTLIAYHIGQALFEMFVSLPMRMGIRLIPLRQVAGKSVHALFLFKFFTWKYIWRFILLEVLLALVIGIPLAVGLFAFCAAHMYSLALLNQIACYVAGTLLILYALYLVVNYVFVNLLIIDRDISPWCAMQLSRQAVLKQWFCIFGTLIWLGVVLVIGALLFGIGLLWAVPYVQNVIAVLYRNNIGIEGQDPVTLSEKLK